MEIEDMTVASIIRNVTQNGITSITVRAVPTRYYDSYKITGIKYKLATSKEEQTKTVENEIQVQFYKEIYTYEDWQTIEEDTYQNYRLMADIDFTGKTNIKNNINVNRLEAENSIYTLKNIELEFNEQNTGLINNVKTSIKNIGFEGITLTNTIGSGNYFGVIASNNGNIENLQFNDVAVDGIGISYVGLIGGVTSGNIENIGMKNINIIGGYYSGGLVGIASISEVANVCDITGDNVTVMASSDYVGGVFGHISGNEINMSNLKIENSNITGEDYIGGLVGNVSGVVIEYLEVNNTNISGGSYVGGILGRFVSANDSKYTRHYVQINSSTVRGIGNNIGGISGYSDHGAPRYWLVNDTIINGSVSSQQVGGLTGSLYWTTIYYFQIVDTKIYGGYAVGGAGNGASGGRGRLYYGDIENTYIKGNNLVGGVLGQANYNDINTIYVNADIVATSHSAGGIVGYLNNASMTASYNNISITGVMVLDSSIKAPTGAGGLIGDMDKEIYREQSFYHNNYIDADVTSENTSTGSLIIGGRPDENSYIENTYVYRYSTLNGNYVYATNDNVEDEQYLIRSDLDERSTYEDKIQLSCTTWLWNFAILQEGKYPNFRGYVYDPELQKGIDLPTDPEITELNSLSVGDEIDNNSNEAGTNTNNIADENGISTQSIESLPSYKVYPTSVDEINIDFGYIPEGVSFTYSVNGEEKETVDLEQKTYTFKYNYQDTLEIKLTNGVDEEVITITPEDVRSNASLVGSNNAYLLGTSLYINGEVQSGEYVNVYDGFALNSSGQIVDIATKQTVTNAGNTTNENTTEAVTTTLEQTTTPLHTYSYNGSTIETYGTYSEVNDNVKLQIYNVRNGELSALSNNLDMKINNYIVDSYNNKEYQTILSSNGELVDLKEMLQYPDNFLARNIKQIVQNTDVEKTEMMVLYNTGKVIVFNYVTGDVVYETEEKADSSLADYITGSLSNIWSNYEQKQQEYAKSKELETKLAELPIEKALQKNEGNNGNTLATNTSESTDASNNEVTNANINESNRYISVYNEQTGEYEVYSEDEILNGEEETPVSETTKIKENGLESVYNYETNEESKPQANGAVIVISIIAVAVIALVVLRKIIIKNNKKEKNK